MKYHAHKRATEAYQAYVQSGERLYGLVSGLKEDRLVWASDIWSIKIEDVWVDFKIINGKVKVVS